MSAKLNMSIRWKMLAGFLISAMIPSLLSFADVSPLIILIISLSVALSLAFYSIFRVMNTLNHVQSHLSITEDPGRKDHDELRLIDESISYFEKYLEKNRQDDELERTYSELSRSDLVEKTYKANLQTGEPVYAEIWELTGRRTAELVSSARLVGNEALAVFTEAKETIISDLDKLKNYPGLDESNKGIIDFQIMVLHDPAMAMEVEKMLESGENLLSTISKTFDKYIEQLEYQGDQYIKERVADFNDLRQRIFEAIHQTSGQGAGNRFEAAKGKIAISQHVLPSEVISLCNAGVAGIVSLENTPSSHTQILLSSLNVSSLSSIKDFPISGLHGHTVLLDTMEGSLIVEPGPKEIDKVMREFASRKSEVITEKIKLKNGEEFNVGVTVNNPQIEINHAVGSSPDFVGLFRTEMHFLGQSTLPSEEELTATYRSLIESFPDDLVVVRMLDLGGDKISGFEGSRESEENPCMGLRSMRLLLEHKELFNLQLRSILKASHKKVCLLYPMISGWSELDQISTFVEQTVNELKEEGVAVETPLKGIMVEVPSIVTRFEDYVDHFDVFNIGTNDLIQYTLAADRNNDAVSDYYKSWHPSILSMIKKVVTLCKERGKKAIICGQMGSDFKVLPLLIGLGVRNISVNWPIVNQLKKLVIDLDVEDAEKLSKAALQCISSVEVEKLIKS